MALVPWRTGDSWVDQFQNMDLIQREINRLFDFSRSRGIDREVGLLEGAWSPAIDLYDSKDSYMVRADIPGMRKEDIEVTVRGNQLLIRGEKKYEKEIKEKEYVRSERFYGSFHRAIMLPAEVDHARVAAAYVNGVLELTLPKQEESKPKQVTVEMK